MNPFVMFAQELMRRPQTPAHPENSGITSRIRDALLTGGPSTSRELATCFGLPVGRIHALLKNDLAIGRVTKFGEHFEIDAAFHDAEPEIDAAKALLRKHGYAVFRSARSSRSAK